MFNVGSGGGGVGERQFTGSLLLAGLDVGSKGMLVAFDGSDGVWGILGDLGNSESWPAGEKFVPNSIGPRGDGGGKHGGMVEGNAIPNQRGVDDGVNDWGSSECLG